MSNNKSTAVVTIVVNSPTASPVVEGNVSKAKDYMEQTQEVLNKVQLIQQETQSIANNAAQSAESAAESATSAFAAAAPLWEDSKTYNPPDVVAGSDGNTYRCITQNTAINPTTDNGLNWKQITYNTNGIVNLDSENNIIPFADTTGNIVPNDLGGDLGAINKKWNNIYAVKMSAQSMEINGEDIESLASSGRSTLKRNTTYDAGDIVYSGYFPNWMYVECIQGGVTGDVRPDSLFPKTSIGEEVTDGTAKWITRHIHDGHVKGEVFPMSGASFDSDGFLIHPVLNISMKDTHVCDGTNDTPDLRGRFILGNSDTHAEDETGGEETHVLTWEELAEHNHPGSSAWNGEHSHDIQANKAIPPLSSDRAGHINLVRVDNPPSYANYDTNSVLQDGLWMTSAGGHDHAITIGNAGSNKAHNNMPPYYTLVYVKKIK